jgi:hypothetical protein
MKNKFVISFAAIACIAGACSVLSAHHGGTAYDRTKLTNFKATITEFRYINPHVQIFFDAKDEKGNVKHWNCESINPGMLSKQGWTKNTLKPGDQVTLAVFPAREGAPVCLLQKLTLADGKTLNAVLLD